MTTSYRNSVLVFVEIIVIASRKQTTFVPKKESSCKMSWHFSKTNVKLHEKSSHFVEKSQKVPIRSRWWFHFLSKKSQPLLQKTFISFGFIGSNLNVLNYGYQTSPPTYTFGVKSVPYGTLKVKKKAHLHALWREGEKHMPVLVRAKKTQNSVVKMHILESGAHPCVYGLKKSSVWNLLLTV